MSHLEHRRASPTSVNCAIVTISDSRTEETDESGKLYKEQLSNAGHKIMGYALLKNDSVAIHEKLEELVKMNDLHVIICSGGTGLSHRDITVETVTPMLEKRLDGFGELFRYLSFQEIGADSILSRSIAGAIGGKIILCLPGSLGATKLAVEKIILPEIGHMVREATR